MHSRPDRSEPRAARPREDLPWDLVDELVFRCLDLSDARPLDVVESVCAEHAELVEPVRRCLERLATSGMIDGADAGTTETFGELRILQRIGQGGMGVVDLAAQPGLDRLVALKRIRPEMLASEHARERFLREARAAARISHPAICPVFDAGERDGIPYLVMPYLHGQTLSRRIAERVGFGERVANLAARRDIAWVVELFEQLARGLDAAHEAGLVHRDIKPGNIIVRDDGQPVLFDFGLAREVDSDAASLTATGAQVGTLPYMAPEQLAADRPVDRRTDVYGLGVSLYEALTGRLPFRGNDRDELYRQVRHGASTRARSIDRAIPRELEIVVETAMDPEPARRYATALAFADDLARIRRHEPITARRASAVLRLRRFTQRHPALVAAFAVLIAGLATALTLLAQVAAARDDAQTALQRSEALRLARESTIAETRDGRLAVELALRADELAPSVETHSQLNHALQGHRLSWTSEPLGGQAWFAEFSADGRRLLMASTDGNLEVWEAIDGAWCAGGTRRIARVELGGHEFGPEAQRYAVKRFSLSIARLSPDGRAVIAGGSLMHAFVWRPDSRELVALGAALLDDDGATIREGHQGQVFGAVLSDDARTAWTATWSGCLLEWDLAGDDATCRLLVRREKTRWNGLSRLEDGTLLVWGRAVGTRTHDTVRYAADGRQLALWSLPLAPTAGYPRPSTISLRTGRVAASSRRETGLWDLDGDRIPLRGTDEVEPVAATLAPDGESLATVDSDGCVRLWDSQDGSLLGQLSALAPSALDAVFSPDGQLVAVMNSEAELLVYDLDGTLRHRVNGLQQDFAAGISISADRRWLCSGGGEESVRVWDLGDAREPAVLNTGHAYPGRLAVSPDGARVAFADTAARVRVWEPAAARVTTAGTHPGVDSVRLLPDGRVLSGGGGYVPQAFVWDPSEPGKPRWTLPTVPDFTGVSALGLPRRDAVVVAFGRNNLKPPEVHVYPLTADAKPTRVLVGPDGMQRVNHADVDAEHERVAVASADGSVRVWPLDLDDGGPVRREATELLRVDTGGGPALDVRFSARGDRIAFGAASGRVVVAHVDGSAQVELVGHEHRVVTVRFADDDRLLLTASMDGTARGWDAATGEERFRLRIGASSQVWAVDWLPATATRGARVVTASADARIRTWIVDRDELRTLARTRLALR